jgi:hypothetical protein
VEVSGVPHASVLRHALQECTQRSVFPAQPPVLEIFEPSSEALRFMVSL